MGAAAKLIDKMSVWILEDDPLLGATYGDLLSETYSIRVFGRLSEFRAALSAEAKGPSLVIADLTLPDGNYLRALEAGDFSSKLDHVPQMVVSGADDPTVMKKCFDLGCADFLLKPLRLNELRVKVARSLETKAPADQRRLEFNPSTHTVCFEGRESEPLTSKEYQILSTLFAAPGQCATRAEVLGRVWTVSKVVSKTLDVHIFHLRKKLAVIGVAIQHRAPDSFQIDFGGEGDRRLMSS